jgi:EAL domain-containing protein (putative c-di-GMP-specific phosphodiesterase class I)
MGCEFVQSFAFGAPGPAEAMLRMLKEEFVASRAKSGAAE